MNQLIIILEEEVGNLYSFCAYTPNLFISTER